MPNHKWADVAHYYLKSDIDRRYSTENETRGEEIPVLRHLRDMTEIEACEYTEACMDGDYIYVKRDEVQFYHKFRFGQVFRPAFKKPFYRILRDDKPIFWGAEDFTIPAGFHWLISKGFDVFGLIESGQAIRKGVES